MPEDEIKIRLSAEDKASEKLKEVAREEEKLAGTTKRAGHEAEEAGRKQGFFGTALGAMKGQLLGLLPVMSISGGIAYAYKVWREQIEATTQSLKENAAAVKSVVDAERGLLFLGADKAMVRYAEQAATGYGRDANEGVAVAKEVISRRGESSPEQQRALIDAAMLYASTSPEVGAATAASTLLTTQNIIKDPMSAASKIFQSTKLAGESNPQQFGAGIGRSLGVLTSVGRMTPDQALGLMAGTTGQGLPTEVVSTGWNAMTARIFGDMTPDVARVLKKLGINTADPSVNLQTVLDRASAAYASGQLSDVELSMLSGPENLKLATMGIRPDVIAGVRSKQSAIAGTPSDFLKAELARVETENPEQAVARKGAAAAAETEMIKGGDAFAQVVQSVRNVLERELTSGVVDGRVSEVERAAVLAKYDETVARGVSPYIAAKVAQATTKTSFFDMSPGADVDASMAIAQEIGPAAIHTRTGGITGLSMGRGFARTYDASTSPEGWQQQQYVTNIHTQFNAPDPSSVPSGEDLQ